LISGDSLLRWSVRLSIVLMLAAWLLILSQRSSPSDRAARWAWTAGFAVFLVHLWAAFEYVHRWSHVAAVQDIARQTRELVGLEWGGEVWLNYAFALVWGVDVAWWNGFPASHSRRPLLVAAAIHAILGFIMFNATVVFASGVSRWLGVAGCGLLIAATMRRRPHGA